MMMMIVKNLLHRESDAKRIQTVFMFHLLLMLTKSTVISEEDQTYPPILFQHQPANLLVPDGKSVTLNCQVQSGGPLTEVTWIKDGATLRPNQYRQILKNDSLVIHSANRRTTYGTDEGAYQCSVNVLGIGTVLSRKGRLKIESAAGTTNSKETIHVEKGDVIILPCKSTSTVEWSMNGLPLNTTTYRDGKHRNNKSSKLSLHQSGELEIAEVGKDEYGEYQCRSGIGKMGLISSVVLVENETTTAMEADVLRFSREPQNIRIEEGELALFPCGVHNTSGHVSVSWKKNGVPIKMSDRVHTRGQCSLYLWRVSPEDAGAYECRVSTSSVEIFREVLLDVLVPPAFTSRPHPTTIGRVNDDVILECNTTGQPAPLVTWYKNGDMLVNNAYFDIGEGGGVLRISSLLPSDGGLYQCMAENEVASDQVVTRLVVIDTADSSSDESFPAEYISASSSSSSGSLPTDKVRSPSNLKAFLVQSTSVGISWEADATGDRMYLVEWRPQHEPGPSQRANTTLQEMTVSDLSPSTTYSFSVSSFLPNSTAVSDPTILNVTTIPRVSTSEVPRNVTGEALDSTSISVTWELPRNVDASHVTGFELRHHIRDQSEASEVDTKVEGTRRSFDIIGLQKGTTYSIRIAAIYSNGASPYSTAIHVSTLADDLDESRQPGKPSSLRLHSTSNTISVSWTPPADSRIKVRGYVLGYGIGIPDMHNQVLDPRQRFEVIKKLTPSSVYVVNLKAYNNAGEGVPIFETIFTKEEAVPHELPQPMTPPVALKTKVVSSTSITLSWNDASFNRLQKFKGTSDGRIYVVRFNPKSVRRYKYMNVTGLEVNVRDLRPDTEYEFNVKVMKGVRQSGWSLSATEKTKEAAPSSSPRELSVITEEDPSNIILTWHPPRQPNGKITGYAVHYSRDVTVPDEQWFTETVKGEGTSVSIEGLSRGATYFFKVQAKNEAGLGPVSPTIIFRTAGADGKGGGVIEIPVDRNTAINEPPALSSPPVQPNQVSIESSTLMWVLTGIIGGCVTLLLIIVAAFVACKLKSRNKSQSQSQPSNEVPSSPDPSSGKSSLKPPDLWTHGGGLNDFVVDDANNQVDQVSDDSSVADRWTLRSSKTPDNKEPSKFKTSSLRPATNSNSRLTESSSLLTGDIRFGSPSLHPTSANTTVPSSHVTSALYQKSQFSSTPRVYVGDVAQSTIGSRKFNVNYPPLLSQPPPDADLPPPLQPLSSPHIILPSKHLSNVTSILSAEDRSKNSTEDLSREMANIEGLMKDLNAISRQHHFVH